MKLGKILLAAAAFPFGVWAQFPDPPHLIDPNLLVNPSPEGTLQLVLPKGLTQLSFSVQRRTGDDRHDANGDAFHVSEPRLPDFRFVTMNLGVGLGHGLDVSVNVPYEWVSDPLEAPRNWYTASNRNGQVLDRCAGCTGMSDVWATMHWQPFRRARVPLVVQGDFKFPEVYRHSNPYLGTGAHDFQLSAWTVLTKGNFWFSPKMGYLWRGGNFADATTYLGEIGWRPFGRGRARGFYLRARMDGSVVTGGDKTGASVPRYAGERLLAGSHPFTLNDAEGHRASLAAGIQMWQWNFELSWSRWLQWYNGIGFKEWNLTASRPLANREFVKGDHVVSAPTAAEAKSRNPNSVVLAPGDIYIGTSFDWHYGQDKHDSEGRPYTAPDGREHDFRFLTQYVSFGLPKGFEVDAMVPYFWGKELLETSSNTSPHTGLNDIWVSLRKQVLYNSVVPLGVALDFKFPEATRHADRYLGEDKHDVMISVFTNKSGTNWWIAPKFAYRWREGAFSDELPYAVEGGYRPWFSRRLRDFYLKTVFDGNFSLHNASPATSGDRFGNLSLALAPDHYFTFNEGTVHRFGYGAGIRLIRNWNFEFVRHKYLWWANNNGYERDLTFSFSKWF